MLKTEHYTSSDDLSEDVEVLWLQLSKFYFHRQMIADTINSLLSDDFYELIAWNGLGSENLQALVSALNL